MCGLWTRPWTDVDPPTVELPSAGAYRLAAPGGDNLFRYNHLETVLVITEAGVCWQWWFDVHSSSVIPLSHGAVVCVLVVVFRRVVRRSLQ